MMMKKKIISGALFLMLTASLLSGCGKSNGLSALDFSNTTLSGTITAVDGDKVTIAMTGGFGGGRTGNRGNGDDRGNRDKTNGQNANSVQTMPEMPEGQTPPDMPEGTNGEVPIDMPEVKTPGNGNVTDNTEMDNAFGNMFSQGGSTFTLTITDESLLEECTMDDVAEGSFITITFGDNSTITSITVMKLTNTENAAPNGTAPEQQKTISGNE